MNSVFWAEKRVLVTGHTGFKGGWLALWLQKLGAKVIGYSLSPPTKPNLFEVSRVADGMQSIEGDVRILEQLKATVNEYQPEIVIHMAAQSLVRYSYAQPVETYATNVMGTVNILEAVRQSDSVRVILNVTSDKCYENKEWVWGYRENERLGGRDPYSSSKGCAEIVTSAYRDSYFKDSDPCIGVASARAGNVIGGGDWAKDRLIPDIMNAFIKGHPVVIRHPNAIRPWQHVLEPLSGYLCLVEHLWDERSKFAGAWNFGPDSDDAQPVTWVVDQLIPLWGEGARWELDAPPQPHEACALKLDCSKARSLLHWSPKLQLSTALEWVVNWYRGYQQNRDMRRITEAEIAEYESRE